MKIPNEPTIKSSISGKSSLKTEGSSPNGAQNLTNSSSVQASQLSTEQARQLLQQLNNTWAKVQSSQPIKPEDSQQLTHTTERNTSGRALQPTEVLKQSIDGLLKQKANQQQGMADIKLTLIKLVTEQGLINLISSKSYPKGADVFITQNSTGNMQLQLPSETFSLVNMAAQLSAGKQPLPPLPLPATWPFNNSLTLPPLPASTLNTQSLPTAQTVQTAVQQSGHFFERHLVQALKGNPPAGTALEQGTVTGTNAGRANTIGNINHTFQAIGENIKQWTQQFSERFQASGQSQNQTSHSQNNHTQTPNPSQTQQALNVFSKLQSEFPSSSLHPTNNGTSAKQANTQTTPSAIGLNQQAIKASQVHSLSQLNVNTDRPIDHGQKDSLTLSLQHILKQDQKLWLQTGQQQLTQALSQHLMENKEAFVPNWSNTLGQIKSPLDLSNWLTLLVAPKPLKSDHAFNIWPSNLSSQSQIHQTLTLLMANSANNDQSDVQQALRQLLSLSQSLMKIQHDQLQGRLPSLTSEQQGLQLNIPYVHQQQLHWAEFEYQSQSNSSDTQNKTTGWHLILRFAQNTQQAFAIESQLKQEQATIVLWATDKDQLQYLHSEIPRLKGKLLAAGFQVENISSKHGAPAKLNQPLQQSLVDIHT